MPRDAIYLICASLNQHSGRKALSQNGAKCPFFRKNVNGMDICIQNVSWPMVCSIVKGHMDSNEVPAGEITSPSCLDRRLPVSEQVSCSQMKMLHLREDAKLSRTRFFLMYQISSSSHTSNVWYLITHQKNWKITFYTACQH